MKFQPVLPSSLIPGRSALGLNWKVRVQSGLWEGGPTLKIGAGVEVGAHARVRHLASQVSEHTYFI